MSRITKSHLPFDHHTIDLLNATDDELVEIANSLGLGLNLQELRAVRDRYMLMERRATDVELQTYDQTWSEHCFHKTFKGVIETPDGVVDGMLKSYLGRVVSELDPPWCFSVFEDNAGIVDLDDEHAVAIKVETHNHPSAIEPFGGAATGLGGVIRDILGVWADPIACTDVLCFGPLDYPYEKLPEGVKHPSYIFSGVVDGIGSYGNSIGIPTVNGAVYFDEDYTGNVVVYAGCIGLLRKDRYIRNVKAGDLVVLTGGRTGLDGIHGVTFASAELTEESEEVSRPAVQIANPIEEEKIKRAIKQISEERLGSGITDLGGGGLSCAVCELADRYGLGAEVKLERVPLKAVEMAPWEIWISESQERMCLAVPAENLDRVLQIFEDEQVEANEIGRFTGGNSVKVEFMGERVAELDLEFLFNPPRIQRSISWKPPVLEEPSFPIPDDLGETLKRLLAAPNIASKEVVVRRYDHEVKGGTIVKPLQGWNAGPSDGAVLKPLDHSWRGVTVACGMNPRYGKIHPYWMAASALDEAIRNSVALGGRRIAILDNFTWGNPEYEDRLGGLVLASKACYDIARVYGTPFISGKDSLYNESPVGPVAPTLLITALGIVPDVRKTVTMDLKEKGSSLYIVGETKRELGGSEYYRLGGYLGASVPRLEPEKTIEAYRRLTKAMDEGFIRACHDLSEGGLGVAAAEMAFTGGLGLELDISYLPTEGRPRDDLALFSESNGRLLVEVTDRKASAFEKNMEGTVFAKMGEILGDRFIVSRGGEVLIDESLTALIAAWKTPLGGSR
ncbi:MAG: phosphoribosylformylglycinamidine synthase subunit PurL [Candidatus Bathyarchaeota archaeon]|nr:MAG: phosphoribosylformylglycinamidine synthase subunit PurL [Candidatus Bathyarchaeota archaeon]